MKKIIIVMLALCSLVLMAMPASAAIVLDLYPTTQDILVGDTASVDLRVSGVWEAGLGGFDLDIGFDPSVLSINPLLDVTIYDAAGNPDSLGFASSNGSASSLQLVNLFTGGTGIDHLNTTGVDPIVIATMVFTGATNGFSPLSFFNVNLSDSTGFDLIDPLSVTTVDANVNVVPVPPSLLLLGTGLIGMVGFRRKFNRA